MIRNGNNDALVDQFKKLESRIYKMENNPNSRRLRNLPELKKKTVSIRISE